MSVTERAIAQAAGELGVSLEGAKRGDAAPASGRGSGRRSGRRSGRSQTGPKVSIKKGKQMTPDEYARACGFDGAFNKPEFNSGPYVDPTSTENFFKRGGGAFKAGKNKTKTPYVAGAVHSTDPKGPKKRPVPAKGPAFRPSASTGNLFRQEPSLGPADQSKLPKPRAGGALKGGTYAPKKKYVPEEYTAARDFKYVVAPKGGKTMEAPPFKAGAPPKDFFDTAYLTSEPIGPETLGGEPTKITHPWRPAAKKGTDPLGRFPEHVPNPYDLPQVKGAEGRHGGFGICVPTNAASQSRAPVPWWKTRTGDVYRTRDLSAAAAASGMPGMGDVKNLDITTHSMAGGAGTMVNFNWTM